MPQPHQQDPLPAIPDETLQEGARWRHWKPTSQQVAAWFDTVPLDEGMKNADFVGGVVIIPQSEKVKYTRRDGRGTVERYEMTYTPYMQIGTRIGYMRRLAEHRELIYHPSPVKVPRSSKMDSMYFNANMPDGLWWHAVRDDSGNAVRYLCCTMQVALYTPQSYMEKLRGHEPMPVLYGQGTKQVGGGTDPNGLMKAQTGAIGRALGVAGILVVGTGIATAEDMQEFTGLAAAAPSAEQAMLPVVPSEIAPGEQPEATDPAEALDALRARALATQTKMQERTPQAWREFVTWWQERRKQAGWEQLSDVPYEALRGIVGRMEDLHAKGLGSEPEPGSQAQAEGGEESPEATLPAD